MKNYSKIILGKGLEELEYSDIINYFNEPKEESSKIEFKAYHPKFGNFNKNLEGVTRGICAFLNSEGGILIWGAPLERKEEGKSIFQGDLSLVEKFFDKDSLISKISDSISPLPTNINVKIIEHEEMYLYVFEIEKSNYSPHQFKNTYYVRLDGQTKPAPHYLVEALMRKISYPNIEGYIKLDKFGTLGSKCFLDISICLFNFSELQNEKNVNYNLICDSAIFQGAQIPSTSNNYSMGGHQFINKGYINILFFGSPEITQQRLIIDMDELSEKYNYEMNLILSFGGENSPLKISEYKLDLGISGVSTTNPHKYIVEMNENILSSDKQKSLNSTKEILLKKILGR